MSNQTEIEVLEAKLAKAGYSDHHIELLNTTMAEAAGGVNWTRKELLEAILDGVSIEVQDNVETD